LEARLVQNAGYFRDQAALCLEVARQMSDPEAAENMLASAAKYFAKANELEKQAEDADFGSPDARDPRHSRPRP